MNGNDDKTTIRVKVADDYQDIVIDWSAKESDEIHQSIIQQLSAFTGLPSEKTQYLTFQKPGSGLPYRQNPFCYTEDRLDLALLYFSFNYCIFKAQDMRDHFFTDGDCFVLNSKLLLSFDLDTIWVNYSLMHQDLIDATECSEDFCHHICIRAFLDKQAAIFKSDFDFESYLLAQPRRIRPRVLDVGDLVDMERRKIKILANFNIGQYFDAFCCRSRHVSCRASFNMPQSRIYFPHRG